jgi:hypothetical protein
MYVSPYITYLWNKLYIQSMISQMGYVTTMSIAIAQHNRAAIMKPTPATTMANISPNINRPPPYASSAPIVSQ